MSQNNQNNSSDDNLIVFGIVLLLIGAIIYFTYPILKEYFLTVKLWQLHIISIIHPSNENLILYNQLKDIPSYNWTNAQMVKVGNKVNYYFLPFALILMYVTFVITQKKIYKAWLHSKSHTAKSLLDQEKKVWTYLEPIAHLNLLEQDSKEGEWASAKKPQEIALQYNLLNNKFDNESLNREKAAKYFASQLGNLYTGADNLPIGIKALAGCFMARIMEDKNEAKYALMDIATSFGKDAKGKYNFEPGLILFEKYKNEPKIKKLINQHAYVNTVMARLFEETKKTGIFITKYFLWLKPYDRKLYYMLNNIGRETAWIECAGIYDHYQYEKLLKRPMAKLFVEKAVDGLEEELKRVKLQGE